jgi:hypothetical protein
MSDDVPAEGDRVTMRYDSIHSGTEQVLHGTVTKVKVHSDEEWTAWVNADSAERNRRLSRSRSGIKVDTVVASRYVQSPDARKIGSALHDDLTISTPSDQGSEGE